MHPKQTVYENTANLNKIFYGFTINNSLKLPKSFISFEQSRFRVHCKFIYSLETSHTWRDHVNKQQDYKRAIN